MGTTGIEAYFRWMEVSMKGNGSSGVICYFKAPLQILDIKVLTFRCNLNGYKKNDFFTGMPVLREEYSAVGQMCDEWNSKRKHSKYLAIHCGKLQIQQEVKTAFFSLCLVLFSDDSPLGTEECNSCKERSPTWNDKLLSSAHRTLRVNCRVPVNRSMKS